MPRNSRKASGSGYYHVTIRGNAKQIIFEDTNDYRHFLNLMEQLSAETGVSVCAFCLMANHVHLLLHDSEGALPKYMQRLSMNYARYFNWKYERSGHLFQDRYYSEPIEDDSYFLSVLSYILNNPKKAGISGVEGYPWSSYMLYNGNSFVDTELIRGLLPTWEEYEELVLNYKDPSGSAPEPGRKDDKWAAELICEKFGVRSCDAIKSFERGQRDDAVRALISAGLSERQIERLTGISRFIIRNIEW